MNESISVALVCTINRRALNDDYALFAFPTYSAPLATDPVNKSRNTSYGTRRFISVAQHRRSDHKEREPRDSWLHEAKKKACFGLLIAFGSSGKVTDAKHPLSRQLTA
jgi:hypothetical protein